MGTRIRPFCIPKNMHDYTEGSNVKIKSFKGVLKSKTVKIEIFLPVKELVLIDKYTPSIRFWSLSLFC